MIVYHGSDIAVESPILLQPKRTLDFGPAFYTTTNVKQAISFANKVMIRNDSQTKAVSIYEIDFDIVEHTLDVLKFSLANEEWLDFVFANRQGIYNGKQYDVIACLLKNKRRV